MSARRVLNLAVRTLSSRALAQPALSATRLHAAPALPCWRQLAAQPIIVRGFAGQSFLDEKEVAERVFSVVKNFEKVDPSKVANKSRFKEDLSLDSLDVVEVVMAIEEEFALEIPDAEADKILSIEDAIKYIASHPQAK